MLMVDRRVHHSVDQKACHWVAWTDFHSAAQMAEKTAVPTAPLSADSMVVPTGLRWADH